MEKDESEIALKRKSKTKEMTADSDDEPIGTLLKVQIKRNLKKTKIVADGGGRKLKGIEKMTGKKEEIGGMDDTLANFRKKLRAPKKVGRSAAVMIKDLYGNAMEQLYQSHEVSAKDRELDPNLIDSKKRNLGSTDVGSSADAISIGGLVDDSITKNKRSKFVSDALIMCNSELGNGFFHSRSGNDALEHVKVFTSGSEPVAPVDSLSTFSQNMLPEMTGKSHKSLRLKEEKEVPVCNSGSILGSCTILQANVGKTLSASELARNSVALDDNCRASLGSPEVLCGKLGSSTLSKFSVSSNPLYFSQMSRSIVDVDHSSTEIISEHSAPIHLLHDSLSSLRTCLGMISDVADVKPISETTGDQLGVRQRLPDSQNILDDKNQAFHFMQAQNGKLPRTVCESISDDVKLVNSLDADSAQLFPCNISQEVLYGTHQCTVEVLGKCPGGATLAPLQEGDDAVCESEAYPSVHTENNKCDEASRKHKDDFPKVSTKSDHVLESSPVFPEVTCLPKCEHPSVDEEANGIYQSPILDDQGSCQEDIGSPADHETKESCASVGQRALRTAKKQRHGDMAYDGDIDWEVLMQGQEFFSSNQIVEKPREQLLSSFAAVDAENGKLAAVMVGLKARGVGPLEKIKFKEIFKRKGGLQEYLECRNHILSFWNKDIRRILPLADFGVSETPVASEDTHASLIREIYIFLDQYGYINFGVPSLKGMIEKCIKPKELLTDEKFVGNSGLPLAESDNGVSSCPVKAEGSETCVRGNKIDDNFQDRGVTEHVRGNLETLNCSITCIAEGYTANNFQHIIEPKHLEIATGSEDFGSSPCSKVQSELMAAALNPILLPVDSSSSNSDCAHSDMEYDLGSRKNIIVVGAGPAGLTAARHLKRQGFSVTVLEARSRIGGRVLTDRSSLSVPVDLGASIITGVEADVAGERRPDPSSLICAQLGLELTVLNSECPLYDIVTGQKVPTDLDEALEEEYNSLLDDMVMLAAEKGDLAMNMSLEEGLEYALKGSSISLPEKSNGQILHDQLEDISLGAERIYMNDEILNSRGSISETLNPLERRVMDWHFAHLEYGCAALLKEVSLPNWNQDDVYGGFGGPHCMIKGGYSAVVESLGEGICIHLDHVVSEISYRAECEENNKLHKMVKVSTLNGKEFSGDAVLVTVPLGCLKAETIKFSPPLPQWKHLSIKRLGFGVLNKVVLEFPGVFWDDSIDYFGATADDTDKRGWCFMFWNVKKTVGAPVLIALVVGKAAIDGQSLNPSDHVSHALLVLRKLFGEDNVPDPVASVVTDWGRDPYTYGAYSYVAVGSSGEDYDILGRPVEKCLFFAGEATCREHPDTVGGAMMSGLREAVRIIDILKYGTDCTAEAEAMEAAKRHLDVRRSEVKDIISQLDAAEFSSDFCNQSSDGLQVPSRVFMLRDMFFTAKTMAGRLRLAKELLNLPVEFLKIFASTKEGLSTLNSWILDSMGKDGTQLLRHCVRLLLLVSNDLLAVRLSGVGKTVKEKVCVHTSRDIRSIASQLVSVWVDLFRKEKARRGNMKYFGASTTVNSRSRSFQAMRKPYTKVPQYGMQQSNQPEDTLNFKEKIYGKADVVLSDSQGYLLPTNTPEEECHEILISEEEKAACEAAEAARAAAIAAAKAYATSVSMQRAPLKPPKILSFNKFAMQEQHTHVDEFDGKRNWFGAAVGRQDCLSEIDSWNHRVRDWTVDFSATGVDVDSSKTLADDHSQQNQSNEVACQLAISDHSGESVAVNSSILTKAWVDSSGSIGLKTYNAIDRWRCQAAAASSGFSHGSIHRTQEEDSNKSSKSHERRINPPANDTSTSQVTRSKESKGNQGRGTESIKHAVVDYVASLLMPLYKARKIDREGYKSVMKKVATKVMEQATDIEKAMAISEFLDFKRKNKIRAFVDILIERLMKLKPDVK